MPPLDTSMNPLGRTPVVLRTPPVDGYVFVRTLPSSLLDRLAVITAVVFLIYNGFLLFTYLAAFGEYDALRAASYWRYNTHLGGLCVLFGAYGLARAWRAWVPIRRTARLRLLPIVLLLVMPFAFASKIRFDDHPIKNHVRNVGVSLAQTLKPNDRLAVVDETHNGEYEVILRYAISRVAPIAVSISSYDKRPVAIIRRSIDIVSGIVRISL